jgi:hypothetical protein
LIFTYQQVGWALGAILYEINQLPWDLKLNALEKYPMGFTSLALVIGELLRNWNYII